MDLPSGDQVGALSPRSLNVSWRGGPPFAGTTQMCERTSCLSPLAVSGLPASAARAFGCSHALTLYATLDASGDSATVPTFFRSKMSENVMGRLAACADAADVATSRIAATDAELRKRWVIRESSE